jgi:hypothetical protein
VTAASSASIVTRLLPASTNSEYHGSLLSAYFLTLLSVVTILPGCIHSFLPDGGAGVIAGLDLGQCGTVIIALFAWAGATQIVFGVTMLLVSTRYRSLVPLVLLLVVIERGLHAFNAWVRNGGVTGHRPPEHYAVLIGLPLVIAALGLSLRQRGDSDQSRVRAAVDL